MDESDLRWADGSAVVLQRINDGRMRVTTTVGSGTVRDLMGSTTSEDECVTFSVLIADPTDELLLFVQREALQRAREIVSTELKAVRERLRTSEGPS